MTQNTRHFVTQDPTTFDGNPYEVAERAVKQIAGIAAILRHTMEASRGMLLNAEMERQLHQGGDADIKAAELGAQNSKLTGLVQSVEHIERSAWILARAASFNPKNPPKE